MSKSKPKKLVEKKKAKSIKAKASVKQTKEELKKEIKKLGSKPEKKAKPEKEIANIGVLIDRVHVTTSEARPQFLCALKSNELRSMVHALAGKFPSKQASHDSLVQMIEDALDKEQASHKVLPVFEGYSEGMKTEEPSPEDVIEMVAEPEKPVEPPKPPKESRRPVLADPRMPPVGTILTKHTRSGQVALAGVGVNGIYYGEEKFNSISSAARAVAKSLGLYSEAIDGYIFFGLTKRPAKEANPQAKLNKAFAKLEVAVAATVASGDKPKAKAVIKDVVAKLERLVK